MLAALAAGRDGLLLARLSDAGDPLDEPRPVTDLAELATLEHDHSPRWVWSSTAEHYPALLRAGVRVRRCHDIAATERILLARSGMFGRPVGAAAVAARARGVPAPDDPVPGADPGAPVLFDAAARTGPPAAEALSDVITAFRDQATRVGGSACGSEPTEKGIAVPVGALRLLLAAESASMLAAAEMTRTGLPWDAAEHDAILTAALGPRPAPGQRPPRLAGLAAEIDEAFGFPVNPDSAVDLREAFRRVGFDIESTRSWIIRDLDHRAVGPVLAYKDLLRLYTANGWNWLEEWIRDGRLASEFVPGGVVSGRWATRGGGALQIPRAVRGAVRARPGHALVVADAAQLEPRVLAAISRDAVLQRLSADVDLYASLASDGFGGDRAHAKVAMLGAMYGQTSGEAGRLLATLRSRYPAAMACVEGAARAGERGRVVASVLGRACPPPGESWRVVEAAGLPDATDAAQRRARQVAASRGRFTRNFVVQASAADWAAVWLSGLRLALREVPGAELVFFQHDELVVHVPQGDAERAADLCVAGAQEARRLVFPDSAVATPVRPVIVACYADAK